MHELGDEATAPLVPVVRASKPGQVEILARALGWEPASLEARTLADWLRRRDSLVAEMGPCLGLEGSLAGREAWNRQAVELAGELQALLGRETAERVASRIPLHRIQMDTGEIRRVDLDGRPISRPGTAQE